MELNKIRSSVQLEDEESYSVKNSALSGTLFLEPNTWGNAKNLLLNVFSMLTLSFENVFAKK